MGMPGFITDVAPVRPGRPYMSVPYPVSGSDGGVEPALPSCGQCDGICDRCFDCLDAGGTWGSCRACNLCNYCAPRSCGGGIGGGGGGGSCDLRCGELRADCYRTGTDTVVCENRYSDCLWTC